MNDSVYIRVEKLEALVESWERELSKDRQRSRNVPGMKDTYTLEGKSTGLNIARTELQELISDHEKS